MYFLQLYSKVFSTSAVTLITVVALLNSYTYLNFKFNFGGQNDSGMFYWQVSESTSNLAYSGKNSSTNYSFSFAIIQKIAISAICDLRDMYNELFIMTGILSLWLIGNEFVVAIKNEKHKRAPDMVIIRNSNSFARYRQVCRLTRTFNRSHGLAMLSYFMVYLVYNATELDRLVMPGKVGVKFYDMEFAFTFTSIFGLGAHFAYQVNMNQVLFFLNFVYILISFLNFYFFCNFYFLLLCRYQL